MNRSPSPAAHRLAVLGLAGAMVLAGCSRPVSADGATQVVAKVNGRELTVHQVNFILQQNPELAAAGPEASRRVLDRLVDNELVLQQALDRKLDRDPQVVASLESARREIVARAYMDRVLAQVAMPTPQEIQAYFDSRPELFSRRQVYALTELQIGLPDGRLPDLRARMQVSDSPQALVQWAQSNQWTVALDQLARPAEGLPMALLPQLAAQPLGQGLLVPEAGMAHVFYVTARRDEPLSLEQARDMIQSAVLNDRKRQAVRDEVQRLHAAAQIEYMGAFAARPASAPRPSPSAAAGGLAASAGMDAETLRNGLGLK